MRLLVTHHQPPGQVGQIGQIGQIGRFGHFVRAWGIATETLRPDARATVTTPRSVALKAGDPAAALVARNVERCRGYHIFMRALRCFQEVAPCCRALIVGGEEGEAGHGTRSFGGAAPWREKMLSEVRLDPVRTRPLGRMSRASCVKVLHVSAAHGCLRCPCALSASLLGAVVCGAPTVASDTAPVSEVTREGQSRSLADSFDAQRIAGTVLNAFHSRTELLALRKQARANGQQYSQGVGAAGNEDALGLGCSARPQHPRRLNLSDRVREMQGQILN